MFKRSMTPILKWAGGKTQLLEHIIQNMPTEYNNYYEPFLGGASVLFAISPERAFVNDLNKQLVNLYTQLKFSVDSVITMVNELDATPCSKEYYYAIRDLYNIKIRDSIFDDECAALMIWVNKHCFNGLYRVNSKGLFNVPYNNKVYGSSIDESNLRTISKYLKSANVAISCLDFAEACVNVSSGDFVYFDSPYAPQSVTASFTDYTMGGFALEDHERLAALFRQLDSRGAKVMLSNNDVPLVRSLYQGYNIQSIGVRRMINRDADKRTGQEALVTNYCHEKLF